MEKITKPSLLVIGGTGFIGHHLLAATHNEWQVTSVSLTPPKPQKTYKNVKYINLNLMDYDAVDDALHGNFDYVVNLGGYIDHTLFKDGGHHLIDQHFDSLKNLMLLLSQKPITRFVQIGSSDEYGNASAPQNEEVRRGDITLLALAKLASTQLLQMLYKTEGFPAIVLRLFLTYGPHQKKDRFIPQIIDSCLKE